MGASLICVFMCAAWGLAAHASPPTAAQHPVHPPGATVRSIPFDPGFDPEKYWTPGRQARAIATSARTRHGKPGSAATTAQQDSPLSPMARAGSWEFEGWPQVGRFFANVAGTDRVCSGAVVQSDSRSVVITAAHCFGGDVRNVTFAPKSDNGKAPYGLWRVKWLTTHSAFPDETLDYAFATVERKGQQRLENLTSGIMLAPNRGSQFPGDSLLIGYPNSRARPLACHAPIEPGPNYSLKIACDAFTGGTSGSPFLVREPNRYVLVGVIGGYQGGGATADISYSSYFDSRTAGILMAADVRGL